MSQFLYKTRYNPSTKQEKVFFFFKNQSKRSHSLAILNCEPEVRKKSWHEEEEAHSCDSKLLKNILKRFVVKEFIINAISSMENQYQDPILLDEF